MYGKQIQPILTVSKLKTIPSRDEYKCTFLIVEPCKMAHVNSQMYHKYSSVEFVTRQFAIMISITIWNRFIYFLPVAEMSIFELFFLISLNEMKRIQTTEHRTVHAAIGVLIRVLNKWMEERKN